MAFGDASKIRAMQRPLYRAVTDTQKCRVDVLANGCPVFDTPGLDQIQSGIMLNLWANSGGNSILARLSPSEDGKTLAESGAVFTCKVTVHDMALPPAGREVITLAELKFDPKLDSGKYPLALGVDFDAPSPFPQWSWLRSRPLKGDAAFETEAVAFAQRLWTALSNKDMNAVMGMQPVRLEEMGKALFKKVSDVSKDMRDQLAAVITSPQVRLAPLQTDQIELAYYANDRLACVNDREGGRAIKCLLPEDEVTQIALYVTRNESGRLIWIR